MAFLITLLMLAIVVFVHEMGHFLMARVAGLPIKTFSVGFGPTIASFNSRNTKWKICLIPLGGYVEPDVDSNSFFSMGVKYWKMTFFLFGGIIFNFISGIIAIVVALMMRGLSFGDAFFRSFDAIGSTIYTIYSSFGTIIAETFKLDGGQNGLMGPIGMGSVMASYDQNFFRYLVIFGLINISIGLINALPLPILDGGNWLVNTIEYVANKELPGIAKNVIMLASLALMIVVGVVVTLNDVIGLVS